MVASLGHRPMSVLMFNIAVALAEVAMTFSDRGWRAGDDGDDIIRSRGSHVYWLEKRKEQA